MAQHGEILRAGADAHPTVVLAEGAVEHPVNAILDPPVAADRVPEGRRVARPAQQGVARLDGGAVANLALALDQPDGAQPGPGAALVVR